MPTRVIVRQTGEVSGRHFVERGRPSRTGPPRAAGPDRRSVEIDLGSWLTMIVVWPRAQLPIAFLAALLESGIADRQDLVEDQDLADRLERDGIGQPGRHAARKCFRCIRANGCSSANARIWSTCGGARSATAP